MSDSDRPKGASAAPSGAGRETSSEQQGTYVYCLLRCQAPPAPEGAPGGLPGARSPRLLEVDDDLWLVVADVDLGLYGEDAIEESLEDLDWLAPRAMGHERMIEHWAEQGDVVPMKLFTIFAGDERAREHILEDRDRIDRVLERVGGCREWGVRVRLDRQASEQAVEARVGEAAKRDSSPGKAFLLAKKQRVEASRKAVTRAVAATETAFESIAEVADDAVRKSIPRGTPVLLDAVFLVPEAVTERLEETVDRCARELSEHHCELNLTGPWPGYHFLDEEAS